MYVSGVKTAIMLVTQEHLIMEARGMYLLAQLESSVVVAGLICPSIVDQQIGNTVLLAIVVVVLVFDWFGQSDEFRTTKLICRPLWECKFLP